MKFARITAATVTAAALLLAPVAANAASSGGSGGPLTDRLDVPFTSGGLTSDYHVFAAGLDWSKTVGLLVYGDGSGGYGLDNPNGSYLLDADGSAGLVAVAKKHNLLLVVPEAPGPGCDGTDNCWYDSTAPQKAAWADALVTQIKKQYAVDDERIVIGGYSSGAQWSTRWFLPTYGEAQSVDLAVAIAYGGAPAVSAKFSTAYKAATTVAFDTGTADAAYTTASYGARGGYSWYTGAGFRTDATWPAGVGHGRSGQFAGIMDREITQNLKPTQKRTGTSTPPPAPTRTPVPTIPATPRPTNPTPFPSDPLPTPSSIAWATTVAPADNGVTFQVQVPATSTEPTYVRLSGPRSVYLYTATKPAQVTFKTLGTDGATWTYKVYAGSSTSGAPLATGTFSTVVR